jgi:hypothetical protein
MEAELAYGKTRGCFEKPSDSVLPKTDISCPDIVPTELQTDINRDAMKNSSILVHPDVSTHTRYVFGTRSVVLKYGSMEIFVRSLCKINFCQFFPKL